MAKKRSLLDTLNERRGASDKLLDAAAAAGTILQAGGASATAATAGAGAIAGLFTTVVGLALTWLAAAFQIPRIKAEVDVIAKCIDRLPAEWANDGTFDNFVLPAISKHLMWCVQESHRDKVRAARVHLAKKLLEGEPTEERDAFHQHVEKFLNDCTVVELVCLIRMALALRTGDHLVDNDTANGPAIAEEELAIDAGLNPKDVYYGFRSLTARGFVFVVASRGREHDSTFLPKHAGASQHIWALAPLAFEIADWLDTDVPPEIEDEFVPARPDDE